MNAMRSGLGGAKGKCGLMLKLAVLGYALSMLMFVSADRSQLGFLGVLGIVAPSLLSLSGSASAERRDGPNLRPSILILGNTLLSEKLSQECM